MNGQSRVENPASNSVSDLMISDLGMTATMMVRYISWERAVTSVPSCTGDRPGMQGKELRTRDNIMRNYDSAV